MKINQRIEGVALAMRERECQHPRAGSDFPEKPVSGHISRCLRPVLLYDGIVTSAPACQIARECPAQRLQVNKPMFKRILIANSGETACRLLKTARLMGM